MTGPLQAIRRKRQDTPEKISDRVRWLLYRKFRAYRSVFDTPEGTVVLRDLEELIRPGASTPITSGDGSLHAIQMARSDGLREVWEHIRKRLALTPDEIERQAQKYVNYDEDTP